MLHTLDETVRISSVVVVALGLVDGLIGAMYILWGRPHWFVRLCMKRRMPARPQALSLIFMAFWGIFMTGPRAIDLNPLAGLICALVSLVPLGFSLYSLSQAAAARKANRHALTLLFWSSQLGGSFQSA